MTETKNREREGQLKLHLNMADEESRKDQAKNTDGTKQIQKAKTVKKCLTNPLTLAKMK